MERETGYEDEECLTDCCRQCGAVIPVRENDTRPDGPFYCDTCVQRTVNRAARSPLSEHVFNTAVAMNTVMSTKVYR